jgi:GGDEF domain-containing protein
MNAYSSEFIAPLSSFPDLGSVLDRASFFALMETAISVAEPGSVPVLMLVELAWRDATSDTYGAEQAARLLGSAPARIAGALDGNGFVCALRETRLAVLAATDSSAPVAALAEVILASLASPVLADEPARIPDPVMAVAQWGVDGETPEELFVAADVELHAKLRAPATPDVPADDSAPTASQSDEGTNFAGLRFRRSPLR